MQMMHYFLNLKKKVFFLRANTGSVYFKV